jgi:hypothetical protein
MDPNHSDLENDLRALERIKLELEEQDGLIQESAKQNPYNAISPLIIGILRSLFVEIEKMRAGLILPFAPNDDQAALRPQIRSARARVNEEINKTKTLLGTSIRPDVPVMSADPRRVFVVHGRNMEARNAMFAFLRAINLDPIEWEEAIQMTGEGSPFIGHVLDVAFSNAQAAVILVTGDDVASSSW